jgi:hypothetical protein
MNGEGLADAIAALKHGRVREAGRTHGRCNPTALAICLKYWDQAGPDINPAQRLEESVEEEA